METFKFVFLCNNSSQHNQTPFYLCASCAIKVPKQRQLIHGEQNVEICLIVTSNEAIVQSKLWQTWLNEDVIFGSKIDIIHCNKCFIKTNQQSQKLSPSLLIQNAIQMSLKKYPYCQRFYIISGQEIPLVSTKHLYNMPNKTQLMAKKIKQYELLHIHQTKLGKLLQWYSHQSSFCLSRKHAQMISKAPWKQYFFSNYVPRQSLHNSLFATTLHAMGVDIRKDVWREITTVFQLPKSHWHKPMHSWQHKCSDLEILKNFMKKKYSQAHELWGYGPCFLRPIVKFVALHKFLPWKLCKVTPPRTDKSNNIDETLQYRKELNAQAYMDEEEIQQQIDAIFKQINNLSC